MFSPSRLRKVVIWGSAAVISVFTFRALGGWLLVSLSYCHKSPYYEDVCGLPLYPYWEYLTWRHRHRFFAPLEADIEAGCLTESAKHLKVMTYQQTEAVVWYKGESKSTWIARFQRPNKDTTWTMRRQTDRYKVCDVEIINSATGGSADSFFWYN